MEEVWKEIRRTYHNWSKKLIAIYEISNLGRLRKNNVIVDLKTNSNGYLLCKFGLIHRLVALTFIPNPENKPCVGHKDCNRLNNNVDNLYWCTYSENVNHPITKQRMKKSMKGRTAWNKGKTGVYSEETRKQMINALILKNYGNTYVKGRIRINNGIINKMVKPEELEYYLSNGFVKGILNPARKGLIWINNGTISKIVKPEELEYYLSNGFVKGRLNKGK